MLWIKRNLFLAAGALVCLVLLGFGLFYLFQSSKKNNEIEEALEAKKNDYQRVVTAPHFPSESNINLARQEQKKLRAAIDRTQNNFQPIPYTNATGLAFKTLLDNTIYGLRKRAEQASVTLPDNNYAFSFAVQKNRVQFAPGSFPALPEQLAEVSAICHTLFDAKVNRLINIRRARVSPDDRDTSPDYHDIPVRTNTLVSVVIHPYQVTFHAFSSDLAALLESFYKSQHGFIVKAVLVDTVELPPASPLTGEPGIPHRDPRAIPRDLRAVQGRLPPGYPARPGAAGAQTSPDGLTTILDEKPLRITLLIEIVKPIKQGG